MPSLFTKFDFAVDRAYAQACTPQVLFQSASSFEGRDASGNAAGFDTNNVQSGDFVIFRDAIFPFFNPSDSVDVIMEITEVNLNSSGAANATAAAILRTDGVLTLEGARAVADSFVTFRIIPVVRNSTTSNVASATPLTLPNTVVSLQDVDSVNTSQNNSDLAGFSNTNPVAPTVTLNSTVELGFQNGGGASGFRIFSDEPASNPPPDWTTTPAAGFTSNTVELEYTSYSMEEFLQGFTGSTNNTPNRGGIFAICTEIPPAPSVELVKSVTNVEDTNNSGTFGDAGDTVNYEFTVENTGNTALANISVDDAGFSVLAGAAVLTQPASGFDADLAIGEGPVVAATATYVIDSSDVTAGSITNTATVTSTAVVADASGNPVPGTPIAGVATVTDTSDTGSNPPINNVGGTVPTISDPSGTGTGNDPTVLNLPPPPPSPPSLNPAIPAPGPQACSAPIVPLPVSSTSLSWTGLNNSGGQFTTNTGGENIVPVTAGALTTLAPVTDDEIVQANGGGGTAFQFNNPNATESGSAAANAWVFDHSINLRVFAGPTFGGRTSAMDQNHDRLVFNATGVTPGFTWVVNGTIASQAVISNGGTTITISAPVNSTPRSFAEFDVTTNGQLTGLTVQRDSIFGTGTNNARFNVQVPLCLEAELNVGKSASVGTLNPDATVDVTYTITVENSGDVQLDALTLVDNLTAADQLGSAFDSIVTGPSVALTNTSGNSTAPTANTSGYNGTNNLLVGTDGVLAPGDSYTVTFVARLNPLATGQPATLGNTATATATDPSDDVVTDASDTDTASDGTADGTVNVGGETTGVPTVVVLPAPNPDFTLSKSADASGLSVPLAVGDTISFTFEVENTGNVALDLGATPISDTTTLGTDGTGATVSLTTGPTLVASSDTNSNGRLDVGETFEYTATFDLTQAAIDAGGVHNTASATGNPVDSAGNDIPGLSDPTDTSDNDTAGDGTDGTADANGNNPTIITLTPTPELALIKSVSSVDDTNGNGIFGDAGDTVNFTFTVENTGNTALAGISVTDAGLAALAGTGTGPTADAGFDGTLEIGEGPLTAATATYILDTTDVAAGSVTNTATGTSNAVATDASGNPDPSTPLVDAGGTALAPVTDASDTGTESTFNSGDGSTISITDPSATDSDSTPGNDGNEPTVLTLPTPGPALEVVKSVSSVSDTNGNGLFGDAGDTVNFAFTVRNAGTTALAGISISDAGLAALAGTATGPTVDAGFDGTLEVGEGPITAATATYVLDATDIGTGSLTNTATGTSTAVATDASGNPDPSSPLLGAGGANLPPVTDISDAGSTTALDSTDGSTTAVSSPGTTDTDGTPGNDGDEPTVLNFPAPTPELEVVKSVSGVDDTNGNGIFGDVGDTVNFTFTVENTGNTALAGISITDAGLAALAGTATGPTADAGFDGTLEIGEGPLTAATATYVLHPDDVAGGSVSNIATGTSTAVATDASGNPDPSTPLVDAGGTALAPVTDTSDTGSSTALDTTDGTVPTVADPSGTDTDGTPGNDGDEPTVLTIPTPSPEFEVVKSVSSVLDTNGNGIFGDVGDTVNFTFTVENTGNTALAGISITDAGLAALSGAATGPTVDAGFDGTLEVDEGPITAATATYVLHPDDVAAGSLSNTATGTSTAVATDASGNPDPSTPLVDAGGTALAPITDTSDTGSTTALDSTDGSVPTVTDPSTTDTDGTPGNDGDEPTVLTIPTPSPEFEVVKSVSSVLDTNGNGIFGDVGDTVNFTFTAENTGNTALAGISIADAGLAALSGAATGPTVDAGFDGTLEIGEGPITVATAAYVLHPDDVAAGSVTNTATGTSTAVATDASGNPDPGTPLTGIPPVTDTSDTGTQPDVGATDGTTTPVADPSGTDTDGTPGNDGDEPTVLTIPTPAPALELVKSIASVDDTNGNGLFGDAGDTVNFTFTVENTGNTALAGISIADAALAALSGAATGPTVAAGFDGTLEVGEGPITAATATYVIHPDDVIAGSVTNTATGTSTAVATDASGNPDPGTPLTGIPPVTDTSDVGSQPDIDGTNGTTTPVADPSGTDTDGTPGNDGDEPTVLMIPDLQPEIMLTKYASVPTRNLGADSTVTDAGDTITYTFRVINVGNVELTDITIADSIAAVVGGPLTSLAVGAEDNTTFTAVYTIQQSDMDAGGVENSATAIASAPLSINGVTDISDTGDGSESSSDPDLGEAGDANGTSDDDGDPTNDPTITRLVPVAPDGLVVDKTAGLQVARIGDIIPYTVTVNNTLAADRIGVDIVDFLPAGLIYRPGTALVDGVATEPTVSGRRMVFSGQTISANASLTITFNVAVSAASSATEFENRAWVEDPATGNRISNVGIATVRREIEHVFDCGDIIGKVYDDRNGNGYQDEGEGGMPSVRLATVKGELITTDKHGRFHVPCAMIPDADIGSNFILKLDERTLPTGYRVTTENPRVIRLTRGKLSKMNFGVSVSRVVRIDLNGTAFAGSEPSAALEKALPKLISNLEKEPSVLRLTYQANGEGKKLGRERMRKLSRLIKKQWKRDGASYDLEIETRVVAGK